MVSTIFFPGVGVVLHGDPFAPWQIDTRARTSKVVE